MEKTKVIFRKAQNPFTKNWDIVAFFPETYNDGYMTCYEHVGQHSEAHITFYWNTKKAMPEEYARLYNELTEFGYNLQVMQRMQY